MRRLTTPCRRTGVPGFWGRRPLQRGASQAADHLCDELRAVFCGLVLEGLIGDIRFLVGLVRDGAQDDEGNLVEEGGVGDGGALHFGAEGVEGIHDAALLVRRADELVAADDASFVDADPGDGLPADAACRLPQRFIRREVFQPVRRAHLGDDAGFISEDGDIHVVVHGICGDDDVADVDIVVQRAGNAGVDEVRDAEAVDQDLCADRGVDLPDAALDDGDFRIAQPADVKLHSCFFNDFFVSHFFRCQFLDLQIHGADNSDFHIFLPCPAAAAAVALNEKFAQAISRSDHAI